MLADGSEVIADLAVLRDQAEVFGPAASTPTARRLLADIDERALASLQAARVPAREVARMQAAEIGEGIPGALTAGRVLPGLQPFLAHVHDLWRRGIRTCLSVGYAITEPVRRAIRAMPDRLWHPALDEGGTLRDGAEVAELTGMVDPSGNPAGTRIIVRRGRPHPGAQPSLLDQDEGLHHQVFLTDTPYSGGGFAQLLEVRHRGQCASCYWTANPQLPSRRSSAADCCKPAVPVSWRNPQRCPRARSVVFRAFASPTKARGRLLVNVARHLGLRAPLLIALHGETHWAGRRTGLPRAGESSCPATRIRNK